MKSALKQAYSRLTKKDALLLLKDADLLGLGMMADNFRKKLHPKGNVSFIIDRNINYTNVCINQCRFCAFYRDVNDPEDYVLSKRKLFSKIRETIACGGTQILMRHVLTNVFQISYGEVLEHRIAYKTMSELMRWNIGKPYRI